MSEPLFSMLRAALRLLMHDARCRYFGRAEAPPLFHIYNDDMPMPNASGQYRRTPIPLLATIYAAISTPPSCFSRLFHASLERHI